MKRCCAIVAVLVVVLLCLGDVGSQLPVPVAEIHSKHFLHGYPLGAPSSSDLIIRECYALSANDDRKFPDWVCYCLSGHEVDGDLPLDRQWHNDPWLEETETLEAEPAGADDYHRASIEQDYDRGHLAPLGSFRNSRFAAQVNLYSNIVPMCSALNRGPWNRLEEDVRALVARYGRVWVMAGPLYESSMPVLPHCDEMHTVPSAFWKIVTVDDFGTLCSAAFIMEQTAPFISAPLGYVAAIDDVERRSGLDFFRDLPDGKEDLLEVAANSAWVETW